MVPGICITFPNSAKWNAHIVLQFHSSYCLVVAQTLWRPGSSAQATAGSPKDKWNVSFGSNVCLVPSPPFLIIMVLGPAPLNHRFGRGMRSAFPLRLRPLFIAPLNEGGPSEATAICHMLPVPLSQHSRASHKLRVSSEHKESLP